MYARYNLLRRIVQNIVTSNSCNHFVRLQSAAANVASNKFQESSSSIINKNQNFDDAFLDLTMDYNRKRFVHSELLTNAIQHVNSDISDRLSLLILTAASRCVHHVTPEKRVELLEQAWKKLNDKNVRLTTRHYEIYLSGLNENGFIFDADYYLKLINDEKIQATPRLYSLLLTQYCREGNSDRAQNFLKMLKERNISIDEDIFAALIVCQLKLGNDKGANDIIQIMKERGLQPTISTYKEILTALISEHKLEQFEYYFGQLESQQRHTSSPTVYIDAHFLVILLGQCISYKELPIFNLLLNVLKDIDYVRIPNNLFNLSVQCVSNGWHDSAIQLLQMLSAKDGTNLEESPYQGIYGRHWVLFFRHLITNKELHLIETYINIMAEKKLVPLDAILRVIYTTPNQDNRLALDYIEQAQQLGHPMRANYFYPLLINAYSNETCENWTDDDRLRLYRLIDRFNIQIESLAYSRILQKSFHEYHQNDFTPLFEMLSKNNLQSIIDRICRLLLNDLRRKMLHISVIEQIAQYFRLNATPRQEEFAKYLFSMISGIATKSNNAGMEEQMISSNKTNQNLTTIFETIDSIVNKLSNDIPMLKHELYVHLFRLSVQYNRTDITSQLAEQCVQDNLQISGSVNEINALTGRILPQDIVEKLARYKSGEMSWKEKLSTINIRKSNINELERIYDEAKQDGKYPYQVQQRLLYIYSKNRSVSQAINILKQMLSNRNQFDSADLHRLFNLITLKMNKTSDASKSEYFEHLQFLQDIYDRTFGLVNLPAELTFRLAHTYTINGDQESAVQIISNKINSTLNDEIYNYLMKFLEFDSSLLTSDSLMSIGRLFTDFRTNEPVRKFWNFFFEILLQKTTPQDVVQYYSDIVRENANIPYLHLFQLFIEKEELNRLQDIVDIATLQHGSRNILHDLGFTLIKGGKLKQAEKIFQTSWLKARNDRIKLHSLLFADSNNLDSLVNSIKLTRNIPDINQKYLFTAAIRVAVRLNKSETIDWLIKEIQENNVQLDTRVRKYLDAHLLSKGLDPLNIIVYDKRDDSKSSKSDETPTEQVKMSVQN